MRASTFSDRASQDDECGALRTASQDYKRGENAMPEDAMPEESEADESQEISGTQPRDEADADRGPSAPTVVGIGASAGGLAALKQFFAQVPPDSGLIFVVVVHLSPDRESHFAEVLQPVTRLPVRQISETTALEPNVVYVIPPNRNISAIDSHLRLSELESDRLQRAPIDHFFRTLAKTHDGHSVAVILSGTGSDGTLGIKAIKERGGLTIVQDPQEAEHDGMPQSALTTGLVDWVLPVAKIPLAAIRFAHTHPQLPEVEDSDEGHAQQLLQQVFTQLRTKTGRNFSRYKRSTIVRRIERRMQLHHLETLEAYLDFLKQHAEEIRALADELLIIVTGFFRDQEVFATLKKEVIPQLFEGKTDADDIRIWCVGCATGEEAYSYAILLLEEAGRRDLTPRFQIFASDLHERSLSRAREGFYPGDIATDVGTPRLRRFFHQEDGGYRIRDEVREMVVFAPHNLLSDPPFSRLDLISCRNVLIYLQREVQQDVIELFHYSLRPRGYLVIGTSETVGESELFRTKNKKDCIYAKRNVPGPEPRLPVFPLTPTWAPRQREGAVVPGEPVPFGTLHQQMLAQVAPPSVLVSPQHRVVHVSEGAGRYLTHPVGDSTTNIFKLLPSAIGIELQVALKLARQNHRAVETRPFRLELHGAPCELALSIRPSIDKQQGGFFLVLFEEIELPPDDPQTDGSKQLLDSDQPKPSRGRLPTAVQTLSEERFQGLVSDYETGREELRASNEELQSANEELRSTLEELETSKEELQSMNEELRIVNQENRHKVEELAVLSSDLQNLLAATEIATLFLDRDWRIVRFTPKISELFNVRMTDRGRVLSDFTHRLGYNHLQNDAQRVLDKLIPIEREIQDEAGRWYLTRVLPYRSPDDRIAGVVITFVDITMRRSAEEAVRDSEEQFRALVTASTQMVWTFDAAGNVLQESSSWCTFTGQNEPQRRGWGWLDAVHPDDRERTESVWREAIQEGAVLSDEFRVFHLASGSYRWTSARCVPLKNELGGIRGWIGMNSDIDDRKAFEDSLQQARELAEAANQARGNFLANMSHEIRTPMTAVLGYADILANRLSGKDEIECVQTIQRNGRFLLDIINDILDLSKIDVGALQIEKRPVAIGTVLNDVATLMTVRAKEKDLSLQFERDPSLPRFIITDPVRLRQILHNLIGNAIKFTDRGSVRVVAAYHADSQQLRFQVIDTGIGIEEEDLERLFQPFTQAETSTNRSYGGAGLGLAISRRLANALDGSITIDSQPARGSTFTLTIDCQAAETGETAADAVQSAGVEETRIAGRILVVDDQRDIRVLAETILHKAGGDVVMAADGQEAIDRLTDNAHSGTPIDLVLMDIQMPVVDGHQAAERIRDLGFDVPLIALTANAMPSERKACLESGFSDFATKPLNRPELLRMIAQHLSSSN